MKLIEDTQKTLVQDSERNILAKFNYSVFILCWLTELFLLYVNMVLKTSLHIQQTFLGKSYEIDLWTGPPILNEIAF